MRYHLFHMIISAVVHSVIWVTVWHIFQQLGPRQSLLLAAVVLLWIAAGVAIWWAVRRLTSWP